MAPRMSLASNRSEEGVDKRKEDSSLRFPLSAESISAVEGIAMRGSCVIRIVASEEPGRNLGHRARSPTPKKKLVEIEKISI